MNTLSYWGTAESGASQCGSEESGDRGRADAVDCPAKGDAGLDA